MTNPVETAEALVTKQEILTKILEASDKLFFHFPNLAMNLVTVVSADCYNGGTELREFLKPYQEKLCEQTRKEREPNDKVPT